ncbi:lipoprotein [Pedobacter sp. Leaf250]
MKKILLAIVLISFLSSCSQKFCPAYSFKHKIRGGSRTGY